MSKVNKHIEQEITLLYKGLKEVLYFTGDDKNIDFALNFDLYELLHDESYLKVAYDQVKEKVNVMEDKLKTKFLNYPIPKKIYKSLRSKSNKFRDK